MSWRTIPKALLLCCVAACSSSPDPLDVDGIGFAEDEVFRQIEIPGANADLVYENSRRILRLHFAGGRLIEDGANRSVEVLPRGFNSSPRRIQVFLRVAEGAAGSRVEIFCKVDELREDLKDDPTDPWRFIGRDANLENRLLHEIWDAVVILPLSEQ